MSKLDPVTVSMLTGVKPVLSGSRPVPHRVYTDGGIIGRNPSSAGGSWAFCYVAPDLQTRTYEAFGRIVPADDIFPKGLVTNNVTELFAAVMAMESLPAGWSGVLVTDSQITMYRVLRPQKAGMGGVPGWLINRLTDARRRLGNVGVELIGGHPALEDLERGRRPDGYIVSWHNVRCDQLCTIGAGREFKAPEYSREHAKALKSKSRTVPPSFASPDAAGGQMAFERGL